MKAISIAVICFVMVPLFSLTSVIRQSDSETFEGVFDGKEDYGYNFIGFDDEGEYTMTFHDIAPSVLKTFNLKSDSLIGTKFLVTFTTSIETETDEDGYDNDLETYTITSLKQIK